MIRKEFQLKKVWFLRLKIIIIKSALELLVHLG